MVAPLGELVQLVGESAQVSCNTKPGAAGAQDTCTCVDPTGTIVSTGVADVPVAVRHAENSDVLLFVSVAVAVMALPPSAPTGSVAEKAFAMKLARARRPANLRGAIKRFMYEP